MFKSMSVFPVTSFTSPYTNFQASSNDIQIIPYLFHAAEHRRLFYAWYHPSLVY